MIAVPGVTVTDAVLVSTTAADEPAWSEATAYAAGAEVSRSHVKWTSLQPANIGNAPETSPAWWENSSPSNVWAAFDTSPATATTNGGSGDALVMVLNPAQRVTSVVLLGLVGATARLQVHNAPGGDLIYDNTINLVTTNGTYWAFCFDPFVQESRAVWYGLPSSPLMQLTITIAPLGGTAQVGLIHFGREFFVGNAKWGFTTPIQSRGRSYLDKLNNPVRIERGYSINICGNLQCERSAYNRLMDFLAEHIDEPMAWVLAPGLGDYRAATIVGAYERAIPGLSNAKHVDLALEISGYR